jgi:hypothetical protein
LFARRANAYMLDAGVRRTRGDGTMLSRLKAGQRARWVWRRAAARCPRLAAMRRRLAAAAVKQGKASHVLQPRRRRHQPRENRLDLLRRPQREHLAGRDD